MSGWRVSLVSSLWLIAVTAEINSLGIARNWDDIRWKGNITPELFWRFYKSWYSSSQAVLSSKDWIEKAWRSQPCLVSQLTKDFSEISCQIVYVCITTLGFLSGLCANPAAGREVLLGESALGTAAQSLPRSSLWCSSKQRKNQLQFRLGGENVVKSFESHLLRAITETKW